MKEDSVILQLYARAPAPDRDYYGLTITPKEVTLNIWNITHGPHVFPKRHRCEFNEFPQNYLMKSDIERTFGKHVVQYCLDLHFGVIKLHNLPTKLFLYILKHLATNDILHLRQTSKIFFELCNSEAVWKVLFNKRIRQVSYKDTKEAEGRGWKDSLMTKILLNTNPYPNKHHTTNKRPNKSVLKLEKSKSTKPAVKINSNVTIINDINKSKPISLKPPVNKMRANINPFKVDDEFYTKSISSSGNKVSNTTIAKAKSEKNFANTNLNISVETIEKIKELRELLDTKLITDLKKNDVTVNVKNERKLKTCLKYGDSKSNHIKVRK